MPKDERVCSLDIFVLSGIGYQLTRMVLNQINKVYVAWIKSRQLISTPTQNNNTI